MVRQLFQNNLLHSGHWHQFAMTVHSPVGKNPEKYGVVKTGPVFDGFANNDLYHDDPMGAEHEVFSDGLKKALYNYMHGVGIDWPLRKFFNFSIPEPLVPRSLIEKSIKRKPLDESEKHGYRFCFFEVQLSLGRQLGGNKEVKIHHRRGTEVIEIPIRVAEYLKENWRGFDFSVAPTLTYNETVVLMSQLIKKTPEEMFQQKWWQSLRRYWRIIQL